MMRKVTQVFLTPALGLSLLLGCLAAACAGRRAGEGVAPPQQQQHARKVPITSSSPSAIALYRQGREQLEKLRRPEAYQLFAAAAEEDPDFALAHFGMAQTSPTTQDFYASLGRAAELADRVSEAERWMILGLQARINGDRATQKRYYEQLAAAYPDDERAHLLVATLYLGRQEVERAIAHLERAIALAPDFPPPYNLLGYAQEARGNYAAAEAAFRKGIELIPDEANPYDSYAELLMKTGRFSESIEMYQKALALDPSFFFSHLGVGYNHVLLGQGDEARKVFQELYDQVDTDGQRRQALYWTAASYLHEEDYPAALAAVEQQYALAEATGDGVAMFDDLIFMGGILLAAGEPDRAEERFRRAGEVLEQAEVDAEVKAVDQRNLLYHAARVALAREDLAAARDRAAAYREAGGAEPNELEAKRSHELAGRTALLAGDYDKALAELAQADSEDPRTLYYQALAYQGMGKLDEMRELAEQAASYNAMDVNFAFIQGPARRLLAE